MLLLSRREIEELLDLDELFDTLRDAMTDLSAGRASVPSRVGALVDERDGFLAAMPGYTPSAGALASKLVTLFPLNAGTGVPARVRAYVIADVFPLGSRVF